MTYWRWGETTGVVIVTLVQIVAVKRHLVELSLCLKV